MTPNNYKYLDNEILKNIDFPCVMGIINLSPDSFFSKSFIQNEKQIIEKAEKMVEEGAKILDLGAISSRPGADLLNKDEEIKRLIPAIKSIKKNLPNVLLSVDTFRAEIAKISVSEGVNLINDISGGTIDKNMFSTIAKLKVPYILMHILGTPKNMQKNPTYKNVVADINVFFDKQIENAENDGITDIIIDPGFGFGKTIEHNFEILKKLNLFKIHNKPILVGLSRKSMIYKSLEITPSDALTGTISLNTIAILKGASILRVHDVKEAVETIKLLTLLK